MYWKQWIKIAPTSWSSEDKLMFINLDVPSVTLEQVKAEEEA